jgi:hypothetical protein
MLDRREFARWCAAGWGTAGLTTLAHAQAPQPETEPPLPTLEELLLTALVIDLPGEHWTPETLQSVLADLRGDLARGRELSGFPLQNGDDPATVFHALAIRPTELPRP